MLYFKMKISLPLQGCHIQQLLTLRVFVIEASCFGFGMVSKFSFRDMLFYSKIFIELSNKTI